MLLFIKSIRNYPAPVRIFFTSVIISAQIITPVNFWSPLRYLNRWSPRCIYNSVKQPRQYIKASPDFELHFYLIPAFTLYSCVLYVYVQYFLLKNSGYFFYGSVIGCTMTRMSYEFRWGVLAVFTEKYRKNSRRNT